MLSEVIAKGVAGRGDSIPADGSDQTRDVSDTQLAPAHGMRSRNLKAGTYDTLPSKLGESAKPPVRQPS